MVKIPIRAKRAELLPFYASLGAAGADVRACLDETVILPPSTSLLIPTGLFFEIPRGYEIQVRPRSGLAYRHQVTVLNAPGTIDSDYRGELMVLLINHGKSPFYIEDGMRIAQIVVAAALRAEFSPQEELALSTRGEDGFGSTGVH